MSIEKTVRDVCSRLGEQFSDYIIIVKVPGGKIAFKYSEPTWAMGAVQRFDEFLRNAQDVSCAGDEDEE